MEAPSKHKLVFQLPVLHEDGGRGYISMAQQAENVYWRCGLLGVDKGMLGVQLMCNTDDRSNFWSMDIEYHATVLYEGKGHMKNTGKFQHTARKYLTIRLPLKACQDSATPERGMYIRFIVTILKKVGIRQKRIHDFSIPEKNLSNLILIVEGKKIYCSKQILAMNSEVLMDLLFPDGCKTVEEIKLPGGFEYDKIIRLIKLFYNDTDALTTETIDETLGLATNLKADCARLRCEKWLITTQLLTAASKLKIATKYGLVELQNECVASLKTSKQIQRLFDNPSDFTDTEIIELMDKVTFSIVGQSRDGFKP